MADSDAKTAAGKPKRVSGDQGTVEVHSIPDQIAADNHNEARKATRQGKNPFAGKRFRQRPPGGTGV